MANTVVVEKQEIHIEAEERELVIDTETYFVLVPRIDGKYSHSFSEWRGKHATGK